MLDQNKLQEILKRLRENGRLVHQVLGEIGMLVESLGNGKPEPKSQNREITVETVEAELVKAKVEGLCQVDLRHSQMEEWIHVKPYGFLGLKFQKVADTIGRLGGKYYPQGKESHWRIPVPKRQQT